MPAGRSSLFSRRYAPPLSQSYPRRLTRRIKDENIVVGASVELVGKVQPGLEVKVLSSWDIGDGVGLSLPSCEFWTMED